ncbi:hypothetical protein ACJX0J_025954, partial [Zea mays]
LAGHLPHVTMKIFIDEENETLKNDLILKFIGFTLSNDYEVDEVIRKLTLVYIGPPLRLTPEVYVFNIIDVKVKAVEILFRDFTCWLLSNIHGPIESWFGFILKEPAGPAEAAPPVAVTARAHHLKEKKIAPFLLLFFFFLFYLSLQTMPF